MEAAANWATVRRLRMSWICSENQYFAQCLWWQTCLRTVKIHPFHFHGNLFDSGVLKLWDDVDGCRTKLVTAIRPWKKPVQIIGPFHLVGVFRVSWHNCFFLSPTIHWEFPPKQGACLGKALCQPLSFLGVLWRAAYVQGTLWAFDTWCCFQRLFPRFWSHFGLKL